jgi:hypothetical protein
LNIDECVNGAAAWTEISSVEVPKRSSRTSRSSCLIRYCSAVVGPGRAPLPGSTRRTYRRSVSAV